MKCANYANPAGAQEEEQERREEEKDWGRQNGKSWVEHSHWAGVWVKHTKALPTISAVRENLKDFTRVKTRTVEIWKQVHLCS